MPLHIANMGSSFAAGPSIEPIANRFAARSGANYASLLAARIGARLTDVSATGATLLNMVSAPQEIPGYRFAPQVEQLPPDADIVLVLGGGNDLGYIGGLFAETASSHWIGQYIAPADPSEPPSSSSSPLLLSPNDDGSSSSSSNNKENNNNSEATAAAAALDETGVATLYAQVLDAIHAKAPRALVLVVEYLTMVGPDARPRTDVPFGAERAEHHRRAARALQRATARAARAPERLPWCVLVPVAEPSRGHGLGARNPWVEGFSWRLLYSGGAYHPNAEGMRAVAEILYWKLFELGRVGDDAPVLL